MIPLSKINLSFISINHMLYIVNLIIKVDFHLVSSILHLCAYLHTYAYLIKLSL
jgi:hypothetical protein